MAPMVVLTRDRSWWGESARSMLFWQRQPLHLREYGAEQRSAHKLRHVALASLSIHGGKMLAYCAQSLWFQSQLPRTDA